MLLIFTDTIKYYIFQVKGLLNFILTQICYNTRLSKNLHYSYFCFISMGVALVLGILTNHHEFILNLTGHKRA
jgi:cellulose synthase/poly-beta-1,6-N-acetylglucosamine synthase-like glycosyltransferase